MNSARRDERGAALVISLIMMVLIAGLVVAYLTVSTSNLQLTANSYDTLQALNVAETGMAKAFHELNAGNTAAFISVVNAKCPSHATADGSLCDAATEGVYNPNGEMIGYRFTCGHSWAIMPMDINPPNGVFIGMYNIPLTDSNGNYVYDGGTLQTREVGDYGVIYAEIVADQRVKLVSTGSFNRSQRAIEVILTKRDPDEPPPFSRYALITDGPINLTGNVGIYGDVHTNDTFNSRGQAHSIDEATDADGNPYYDDTDGDGTPDVQVYTGTLSASGTINGASNAADVTGVNATAVAPSAPEIPIPTFDPAKIIQAAIDAGYAVTEITPAGGTQSYAAGTVLSGIIVVHGNVRITGNVSGDAILVCDGSIFIHANVQIGTPTNETQLMIWAGNDVDLGGTNDIYGYVFATDIVNMHGNAQVTGAIIASGDGDDGADLTQNFVRGTPDIHYRPPDTEMNDFLNNIEPPKWELLSWRECGFRGTNVDLTGGDGSGAEEPAPVVELPPGEDPPPAGDPPPGQAGWDNGKGGGKSG